MTGAVRRTLAGPVAFEGYGLFSALASRLVIYPAAVPRGITLRRTDLPDQPEISATVDHVVTRPRQTVLTAHPGSSGGEPGIHTVEHVMSALAALGITDARLELHGAEVPMADGSSEPFARAILAAGVVPLAGPAPSPIVVRSVLRVRDNGSWIEATPSDGPYLEAEYRLDYGAGAPMASQSYTFRLSPERPDADAYMKEIAPARTFCTSQEAEAMRAAGLFSHLRPCDVLVIGPAGPIDTSYRFEREPARHKVLDMIGDLALAGRPIHGKVVAHKSGHALNHAMARELLAHAGA